MIRMDGCCWAPPDVQDAETVVDWPPWAGDAPLGGQQAPIQTAVMDPRSHAREMMRATLRKRLTEERGGAQGLRMEQAWHSGGSIAYGVDEDVLEYVGEDSGAQADPAALHLEESCMEQETAAELPQEHFLAPRGSVEAMSVRGIRLEDTHSAVVMQDVAEDAVE